MANRDRSMFQTFEWWKDRHPGIHKTVIWAATVHLSKQGDPAWGDQQGTNLGSLIHLKYGRNARCIGFSALAGTFRQGKGNFLALPAAPLDSVESAALQKTTGDANYIDAKRLNALGARPGAFFYHSFQTLAWQDFLDGAVVFRTEYPPKDTR